MYSTNTNAVEKPAGVTCPRCGSVECCSNLLPNLRFDDIASHAWAARRNRPARVLKAAIGWGLVAAANATRDPWSCDHCRWSFR